MLYLFFHYNILVMDRRIIKIDKVYTKGGDFGKTSLGDGSRVSKTDKTIVALANIEELNAHLGFIICIIPTPF